LIIKGLKGLFGFLTILPIGMESMEALSKYFFLTPVVGLVLGTLAGGFGYVADMFLPRLVCGFLVLVVLELLTGFHHMDGLLDFSDAAMLNRLAPKVEIPPSTKITACIKTTMVMLRIAAYGPNKTARKVPPTRCPLAPAKIGKLIIWAAKTKALETANMGVT